MPVRAATQSQTSKVSTRTGVEVDEYFNITFRKYRTDNFIPQDKLKDIWQNVMREEMEVMLDSTINRILSDQLKPFKSQNSELKESMSYLTKQLDYKMNEKKRMLT